MIKAKKTIELLAPAKNKECAIAAINAGADAIYIGASAFGARKNAGNSLEDIRDIIKFAHKFNVKIYVTLNTILFDNEIKEVEKIVWKLYKIGTDAVIFQDFSFFEMNLPPIALHASTQCNNDELLKIKFLKDMNVERVVLPREFSITQIKDVIKNVDIQTEVFVHGALCVSYSGQCYLSNHIGGRSANRGECAQPCRKKYSLVDENGKVIISQQYLLSMKDNNLSAHLKEVTDAGVTSLKIEGRLKDKDYVTNVTSYYRKLLDEISPDIRPSYGVITHEKFVPNIDKTFNRTYTNFYFDEKRKIFINPKTPKFTGEYIGKVLSVNGNAIKADKKLSLNISDKISYFTKNNEIAGTTITKISDKKFEVLNIGEIKKGTKLYRNFDAAFNKSLEKANFRRKLPIEYYISNEKIIVTTQTDINAEIYLTAEYETAQNPDKAKENIAKQLSKLGDTDFVCNNARIDDNFDKFIPISQINELRRNLIAKLEETIERNYATSKREKVESLPQYPHKNLNYSYNVSNKQAEAFYEKCAASVEEYAPEYKKRNKDTVLMKTKHCLRDYANMCTKKGKSKGNLYLVDEFGTKYPLKFDCKNCIMKICSPL